MYSKSWYFVNTPPVNAFITECVSGIRWGIMPMLAESPEEMRSPDIDLFAEGILYHGTTHSCYANFIARKKSMGDKSTSVTQRSMLFNMIFTLQQQAGWKHTHTQYSVPKTSCCMWWVSTVKSDTIKTYTLYSFTTLLVKSECTTKVYRVRVRPCIIYFAYTAFFLSTTCQHAHCSSCELHIPELQPYSSAPFYHNTLINISGI